MKPHLWLILAATVLAVCFSVNRASAAGIAVSDLWLLGWDHYVDMSTSNTTGSIGSTAGWNYPDTSDSSVTVGGLCVDNNDRKGTCGEIATTLTGLVAGASYNIDVVMAVKNTKLYGDYGFYAGFQSGKANQTLYNAYESSPGVNKGRDSTYNHTTGTNNAVYTVRVPVGTAVADANGQIVTYINEGETTRVNPWDAGRLGTRAELDGVIYAKTSDIVPTPRLFTGPNRSGGASSSGDYEPYAGGFNGEADPLASSTYGLQLGSIYYSDRLYCVDEIDEHLVGADYVRTFNSDVAAGTTSYAVTVGGNTSDQVLLMVLMDDRFANPQSEVDRIVSSFATAGTFTDTGWNLDLNDSASHHYQSAFGKWVAGGTTYTFGAASNANSHYMIAAMVPEPSMCVLLLGAAIAMLARRRP